MASLEVQGIGRRFGGVRAVHSLSLTVRSGHITGLIGPNGAGKTTVVNMIAGLLRLSEGRILFDGADIGTLAPDALAELGIARTFQNIRLLSEASALDNVLVGFHMQDRSSLLAQMLGLPVVRRTRDRLRQRAEALLARFGLARQADSVVGGLAYGQQRRIEMARALAMDPKILLLDEPVAGMNDVEAAELGGIFRELAHAGGPDGGLGILVIEHNMRFVKELCDEIHVLASGEQIAHGTPAAVLADPRVIDAYLGSSAEC